MPRRTPSYSSFRLALLLCLITIVLGSACGGGDDTGQSASETTTSTSSQPATSSEQRTRDRGASASGAPFGRGSGGATGAPLKIPPIQQVGAQLDGALLTSLQEQFREECGGTLCVTLRPVDQAQRRLAPPRDDCTFSRTDPPAGSEVRRGSVVKLVFTCRNNQPPATEAGGTP